MSGSASTVCSAAWTESGESPGRTRHCRVARARSGRPFYRAGGAFSTLRLPVQVVRSMMYVSTTADKSARLPPDRCSLDPTAAHIQPVSVQLQSSARRLEYCLVVSVKCAGKRYCDKTAVRGKAEPVRSDFAGRPGTVAPCPVVIDVQKSGKSFSLVFVTAT